MTFLAPGAYTWDDPRYSDPNYVPPGWTGGTQPIPPAAATGQTPTGGMPPAAPVATPGPPPPAPPGTAEQRDANAIILQALNQVGLGELAGWAWQQIVNGASQAQIELQLYDPSNEAGKVVDRLFPELRMQRDEGIKYGVTPMSIREAAAYRTSAVQLMRAAQLPEGFYDEPGDIARFSGRGTSLTELKQRIDDATLASQQAPAETRQQLQQIYGVDAGGLTAYYLDPSKALPVLEKQFAAASLSGAGVRSGYGALNQGEAERLAALGVSADQAQQGFGQLAASTQLVSSLPGENGLTISRDEQLAAVFGGDAAAQELFRKQAEARRAVFKAGGQFGATQRGVSGLGTAASR